VVRAGYALLLLAGGTLLGYALYTVIRLLLAAQGVPVLFKVVILLAVVGLLMTVAGLVVERRREERRAVRDDGDD
jgi:hypothetical protein